MGKASKWIRNFLMGKREDGAKKTGPSLPPETSTSGTLAVTSPLNTPKVRRRWSFRRSTSTKVVTSHQSSRSLDLILTPNQTLLEYQTDRQNYTTSLSAHAAATKIQAVYRSYLAKKALRALRGLVKLQALARGHLVRKRMNIVLRSMQAVLAIQVRARIQRIQMAEEPPVMVGRRKSYRESSASDTQLRKEISVATGNRFSTCGGSRNRSGNADRSPYERVEYGSRIYNSGHFSVSHREYQLHMCPSPSTLSFTDSSSTTYDGQLEEFSLEMARRNSRKYSACPENKHPFIHLLAQRPDHTTSDSHFTPNYMINTKSSRAKARSHSEPRQRPKEDTKQKNRRSSSMDENNENPYLVKLYRSGKSTIDGNHDSNIRSSLIPFEPPINLY
ncbi:protein IQ-DOMAIN 14-like isoform X2 [Sesamum indicum]|uniref:Protein IQ-DOMAIN 14-like isoform X2 n=1 Tax=Sesamum indicum TaxID=4182 RepID=A0A6I9T6D5_SESIN|nr:protein IQ-DOMAIN 14-like isoform X2 [Sesamum indicum]